MAIMKLLPAHTSCDIYVSFSGKDNRGSGMNNLNYVLRDWGIKALMDDGEFKTTGDSISHTDYKEALEESRISIVVLSQDYAHSTWCLDRLVQMLDCRKRKDQQVWPIFYEVVSSDVKNQRNMYGKAMEAHKIRFGENSEKVQKWRSALSKVASLKGLEFNTGYIYSIYFQLLFAKFHN
ncbi:TMV resistance protein N-like [Gastrolobium bilobum]|uniref:TMV resistance protein N-like n=1 Tax=Gastrolobium bilobum TaxID=150636 RepID=UPI002AB23B93|nr:TMV resistance protein N-like [Gastrolobium bilobum]